MSITYPVDISNDVEKLFQAAKINTHIQIEMVFLTAVDTIIMRNRALRTNYI